MGSGSGGAVLRRVRKTENTMQESRPAMQDVVDPTITSLVDMPRLREWLTRNVPGTSIDALNVSRLAGGESNVTLLVRQAGRSWVLRCPPMGNRIATAHDMRREYMFYRALYGTAVPVPEPIALCEDQSVLGEVFYVMSFVSGRIFTRPEDLNDVSVEQRHHFCRELAKMLASIHRVDIDAVELGGIAKREGYLARQVQRWSHTWATTRSGPHAVMDEVAHRLRTGMPNSPPTTVVHGDYRIGNVMVAHDKPDKIIAVFDWEMATLGDPLADVGYALVYWGSRNRPAYLNPINLIPDLPGFMSAEEWVAEYVAAGGTPTEQISYYVALALFKLAVITQGHMERLARTRGSFAPALQANRDECGQLALELL